MNQKTKHKGIRMLIPALLAGAILLSACSLAATSTSNPETATPMGQAPSDESNVPPTQETTATTSAPPSNTGTTVTFETLSVVLPPSVASGATGSEIPRSDSEDTAWWQKTPGHFQVMLDDYYVLQGKFHQPQIYIYPAQEYAELLSSAFESIHRINNILGFPSEISTEQLPGVPFFNALPIFSCNIEVISFQNGRGVRFLTEYAQDNVPVNNHQLFYQFQGVTNDGAYYIIAIFPVTAQMLPDSSDPDAAVPPGGVLHPGINDTNADWAGYYAAVTDQMNATPADSFVPALGQLDALVNSMLVVSP